MIHTFSYEVVHSDITTGTDVVHDRKVVAAYQQVGVGSGPGGNAHSDAARAAEVAVETEEPVAAVLALQGWRPLENLLQAEIP